MAKQSTPVQRAEREFMLVSDRLDRAVGLARTPLLHQFDRALALLTAARKAEAEETGR